MTLTKNFQVYIREMDIPASRPLQIDEINGPDAVYPGTKIFDFFLQGSKFMDYKEYRGPENFEGLTPKNFGHWHYIFEKCMADKTTRTGEGGLQGPERSSYMERWWDALKKVMRLHK